MTDARARLLETLTAHAEHGRPCPSLPQLGQAMRVSTTTISDYLNQLRKAGKIWWRIENGKLGNHYRVVTIAATKKSAGAPQPPKRKRKGAAPEPAPYQPTATALTSPVRIIPAGSKEFKAIERRLLARDAEDRRRRELA